MPTKPRTVRRTWWELFWVFVGLQIILIGVGLAFSLSGKELVEEAAKRLEAMRSAFQSICGIGVVAAIVFTRAKLHPSTVKTGQDLLRITFVALCIAEATMLFAMVGLAKLYLEQFLLTAALIFIVDFGFILPSCLRLMAQPSTEN